MGRRTIALALGCAVGVTAFPAAAATLHPALRLIDTSPLTVRGNHFQPRERVRLRTGRHVRVARASETGAFTARFTGVSFDRCGGGLLIVASGSRGSQARLKLPELECAPGLGP